MKNFIIALFLSFCAFSSFAQDIKPAPSDKAVVYFVRPAFFGFAINFSYFDSTQLIGRFNGQKYIRYECSPGKHLFWARSENRDYVEAEVEAGKIYFIEAVVKMGAVKAAVELVPIDPKSDKGAKTLKKLVKFVQTHTSESFTEKQLKDDAYSLKEPASRGIEKYKEEKAAGKKQKQLLKTMAYTE